MKRYDSGMAKETTYVALLRGINVGGNNLIKMDALRECFEKMGYMNVRTYIASGNVIFTAPTMPRIELEEKTEKVLRKEFNYKATVLVRSAKEMQETVAHFPTIFKDAEWKHNVIFLGEDIDSKTILKQCELKEGIEETSYYKGVLFWSAKMTTITQSNMLKLSAKPEYQKMTVRNVNTTRKIAELMYSE